MRNFKFLSLENRWITIKVSNLKINIYTNKNVRTVNDMIRNVIKGYFLLSVPMDDYLINHLQNDLQRVTGDSKIIITNII